MSSFKSNIDHLTPEIIQKYQEGTLSHQEMHEVEKLMLNSDFEAEAMEGYELSDTDIEKDLAELNGRLEARIYEEKTVFPFWFKVAASVLVLALATIVVINWDYEGSTSLDELAQEESDIKEADEQHTYSEPQKSTPLSDSLITLNITKEPEKATSRAKIEDQPARNEVQAITEPETEAVAEEAEPSDKTGITRTPEPEQLNDMVLDSEQVSEITSSKVAPKELKTTNDQPSATSNAERSKKKSSARANFQENTIGEVRGKVTDAESGEALAGVVVVLKGSALGTVTDSEGNYSLTLPPTEQGIILSYNFVGMVPKEVALANSEVINVELEEDDLSLSEIVVVGEPQGAADDQKVFLPAQPDIGKKAYRAYLEGNVRIPADSLGAKVTVHFDVLPDGTLENFEVKKAPGEAYRKEAIRLVKEGPSWRPATEGGTPVTHNTKVKVSFNLDR